MSPGTYEVTQREEGPAAPSQTRSESRPTPGRPELFQLHRSTPIAPRSDTERGATSEAPAHRAGRLFGGADCGRTARLDLVDEPRRWSEGRGVERCGDAGARLVGLCGPSGL